MYRYGQYCPIAKAVEILGDRWTLLIVRDLLTGTRRFNELERGLPGISRGVLAERLRRLQRMGVITQLVHPGQRQRTEYRLTPAGSELQEVIGALLTWGSKWAFDAPDEQDLDPSLLLWWMRDRIATDRLPAERIVIQFDFTGAVKVTYWLVLTREDVSVCLTDPGFPTDILVTADIAALYQLWQGRLSYDAAVQSGQLRVDAAPNLAAAFPQWLAYSHAAATVRSTVRATPSAA